MKLYVITPKAYDKDTKLAISTVVSIPDEHLKEAEKTYHVKQISIGKNKNGKDS